MTIDSVLKLKHDMLDFEGLWKESIGTPERYGNWIIYGHSGNGKSRFTMQLAKYLTEFGRVAYNSLEEGFSASFKKSLEDNNMQAVSSRKFICINRESIEELEERLSKQRSPDFIFIDSFQYLGINRHEYVEFVKKFPKKLFIWISHAEGNKPRGRSAEFVKYDSGVKIWIEGYKAFVTGRYGGGVPYVIWPKGSSEYHL